MKIVNSRQMQNLDRKTIEEIGIPGIVLMENAALGIIRCLENHYPKELNEGLICILCGQGNNGGDGLTIAKHLYNRGLNVAIVLLADVEKIKGEARTNLLVCQKMGVKILETYDFSNFENKAKSQINKSTLIIDAILGTGLKAKVQGFLEEVINYVNTTNKIVVSVDIPSGISADTGVIIGSNIKANLTVTLGLPKISTILYPAASYIGKLEVVDIGIPINLIEETEFEAKLIEISDLKSIFKPRAINTHKGTYGHLLVLAGSKGKTGAAYLATQAALRIGTGLVTLGIPEGLNEIMEVKLDEAMTWPLPETSEKSLGLSSLKLILRDIDKFDALAIGPGLSTNEETMKLVKELISKINIPTVIDADGLNALAAEWDLVKKNKLLPIMTPHPGEMARLLKTSIGDIQTNRLKLTREAANKYGAYIALKGAGTIISDPQGKNAWVNPTGNPGMSSGGTGDVLTGIIGGLLAQGISKEKAALGGVYLHGLAGDLACKDKGEISLIATDIISYIPVAINLLTGIK
ncbi:MAG: NAD(P)H-hydrate dehydratase [bacterium]